MNFDIIKVLDLVYQNTIANAQGTAQKIEVSIRVVAGIGALIYVFSRLLGQISRNEAIDFLPYLRPFLMILLIASAPKLCNVMDAFGKSTVAMVNATNGDLYTRVKENSEKIQKKIREKWDEIGSNPDRYKEVFGGNLNEDRESMMGMGSIGVDLKIGFQKFSEEFKFQLLSAIQDILMAIMHLAEAILYLISISFRIMLRMGAPIAFAVAIFPGFTSSLAEWFGKYINYVLMPTVAAMYSTIAFSASNAYLNAYDPTTAVQAGGAEAQQPEYLGLAYIALLVMFLIGYLQVPSMTNMLISIGGVGAMVQGATRIANQTVGEGSKKMGRTAAGSVLRTGSVSMGKSMESIKNAPQTIRTAVNQGMAKGQEMSKNQSDQGKTIGTAIGGMVGAAKGVGKTVLDATVGAGVAGVTAEAKIQKRKIRSKINRM